MNECLHQYTTPDIKEQFRIRKWLDVREKPYYETVREHNDSFVPKGSA